MINEFNREALAWAIGGQSKGLIDAAVDALVDGLDSPSLRMLAGARAIDADDDADRWAMRTFKELGFEIPERNSVDAIMAFARLRSWEFLRSRGTSFEESTWQLVSEFYGYFVASGYKNELAIWSGFYSHLLMIDDGTIQGSASDLELQLTAELEKLSGRRDPRLPSGLFRVATNSDQLHDLADTLCAESQREDCSWENITMERFGDSLAGWLNDIRR
jgi:hypothetical protein